MCRYGLHAQETPAPYALSINAFAPQNYSIPFLLSSSVPQARRKEHCHPSNWLRVLDTAERPQIDQGICHQLHPIVSLLDAFKSEQQPLELIFPRKGPFDPHPQRMDGCIEEPLASALGGFAIAGILFDVGDHPRIENALAIRPGVKAAVEIDISASEVQPDLFRHFFQRLEALGQQHHISFIDRSHGNRR